MTVRRSSSDAREIPTPIAALIGALVVGAILLGALVFLLPRVSFFSADEDAAAPAATPTAETGPAQPQLDMRGFSVGNLISDEEFFNPDAMSEDQVVEFIGKWNAGCQSGADGTPCLADYREDAPSWPADQFCTGTVEGGAGLAASSIIYRVAQACQINPAVLLTTLQKEQGLVTASGESLNATRYDSAMGYACPDGTNCDPQWAGFARQVYGAAHQFQRYRVEPQDYAIKAGRLNEIAFNVDKDCGSAPVFVENQATAGLYNYTPYQPTPATVTGRNEPCSTWGNRNFYGLYHAWFGAR